MRLGSDVVAHSAKECGGISILEVSVVNMASDVAISPFLYPSDGCTTWCKYESNSCRGLLLNLANVCLAEREQESAISVIVMGN